MADVGSLSVKELKAELTARGLSTEAVEKCELVARLRTAREQAAADVPTAPPPTPTPTPTGPEDEEVSRVLGCPAVNFYEILGVESSASAGDLKQAYRKLALRLHPDKNHAAGSDEAFKRVGAAFATLKDRGQRAMYDLGGGDRGKRGEASNGPSSAGGASSSSSSSSSFSGGRGGGRGGGGFRDQDAEELYRAFFGEGGDQTEEGDGSATSLVVGRVLGIAALAGRLGGAFYKNPWTLVTLLSGLASLVSVYESLQEVVVKWDVSWGAFGVIPAGLAVAACCPPQYRRIAAVSFALAVAVCLATR